MEEVGCEEGKFAGYRPRAIGQSLQMLERLERAINLCTMSGGGCALMIGLVQWMNLILAQNLWGDIYLNVG